MIPDTSCGYTDIYFALPPQATFISSEPIGPACPLTREAMEQANPHLSPEEVELKFVELQYGKQHAKQVRETMMRRRAARPETCSHVDHYYG